MASTAGTIIEHSWKILRTQGDSTDVTGLQESFMLTLLSQANMEYLKAFRRGGSEPITSMRETGVDLVSDTNLAEATTTATTDFDVDSSTSFASSGVGVIWDDNMPDIFAYTGNAANNLSGVTGLSFAHEDGDTVQQLYVLPTNFKTFRPAETYGDGVRLNGDPLWFMEGPPEVGYFSLYDNGSKYLWLPKGSTGNASVWYEKTSTTIDDTEDTVDVPEQDEFFLVWRIVQLASIPKEEQPTQLYVVAKNEANKILLEALNDRNIGKHVRVRQFGRRYDPSLFQHVSR